MPLVIRQIDSLEDLNAFVRGAITGRQKVGPKIYGLDGLTLIFTTPATTVTFATTPSGEQVPLTLKEVLSQMQTQLGASYKVRSIEGGRLLVVDADASGPVVLAGTGTANAKLGFQTGQATTGTVYNPPDGAAPRLISIDPLATSVAYLVTTEET